MRSLFDARRRSVGLAAAAIAAFALSSGVADAQTFTNSTNIRIPASGSGPGPGSVYPSNIVVSGLTRPVGDISINIVGFTHTFPADVGFLLVGPTGQSVLLMANVGVNCDVSNINMTFADGAPPVPMDCISAGTYSPTSFGTPEFPAPAPSVPYANALSRFSGTDGNGTWSLYVFDDAFLDFGAIAGGWSITFTPSPVSYQGRLDRNGTPVNGNADFVFSLFPTQTGGTALATVALNNVPIQNGLFSVELPFNSSLFDSTPRWIEVLVRSPSGSGFFSLLSERQPLDSTPLALHARTAGFATAALAAENATHAQMATNSSLANHATTADSADTADLATLAVAANRLDAPDGAPTGAVFVTNDGNVGIPTATIGNKLSVFGNSHFTESIALGPNILAARGGLLHIASGQTTATPQPGAQLLVEGFGPAYINILSRDSDEHGVSFGSPASGVHGGIYYTNSVGMDFRTGNNASRMTINAAGNVGMGVGVSGGSIDARLHVAGGSASGRPLKVDRTGSDGELIAFARDDGVVGNITVSGGVVSYNAFTGSHWAWMDAAPERGMLVSMTGDNRRTSNRPGYGEVIYGTRLTSRANDPACLGAYLSPVESPPGDGPSACHQIMSVGNGEMWAVDTGHDIMPGDYLISSEVPGCAMLDDPQRFAVGNVIARAAEVVRWNEIAAAEGSPKRARLSVLFGSFARTGNSVAQATPDAANASDDLRTRLRTLETQNSELRERLERLEKLLTGAAAAK